MAVGLWLRHKCGHYVKAVGESVEWLLENAQYFDCAECRKEGRNGDESEAEEKGPGAGADAREWSRRGD